MADFADSAVSAMFSHANHVTNGISDLWLGAAGSAIQQALQRRNQKKLWNMWYDDFAPKQLDLEKQAMDYQWELDTDYSRQRQKMIEAGMNPNLIYGNGVQGVSVSSHPFAPGAGSSAAQQALAGSGVIGYYAKDRELDIAQQQADTQTALAESNIKYNSVASSKLAAEAALTNLTKLVQSGDPSVADSPAMKRFIAETNKISQEERTSAAAAAYYGKQGELIDSQIALNASQESINNVNHQKLQEEYKRMMDEDFNFDLWLKNHPFNRESMRYMQSIGLTTDGLLNFVGRLINTFGAVAGLQRFNSIFRNAPAGFRNEFQGLFQMAAPQYQSTPSVSSAGSSSFPGVDATSGAAPWIPYQ